MHICLASLIRGKSPQQHALWIGQDKAAKFIMSKLVRPMLSLVVFKVSHTSVASKSVKVTAHAMSLEGCCVKIVAYNHVLNCCHLHSVPLGFSFFFCFLEWWWWPKKMDHILEHLTTVRLTTLWFCF